MSEKTYKVGTLTYTLRALCVMFLWMLGGAMIWTVAGTMFRKATPFILRGNGMSDTFIVLLMGTVYSLMNMIMNPILSFNSDRCRSRLGRRRPFILYTAIPMSLALAAIPFYPYLAGLFPNASICGVSLAQILFFFGGVMYFFFSLFIGAIYFYLIPDVVPVELMGRFYSLFRVSGVLAVIVVNKFIFKHSIAHPQIVFPLIAIIYCVAITAMCLFVKEGDYPDPGKLPPRTAWYVRLGNSVKNYAKECFCEKYYWWFYFVGLAAGLASCVSVFEDFFYKDACNMTVEQIGNLGMYIGIVSFVSCLAAGYLADKFGAIQTQIAALFLMALLYICGGLFIKDYTSALLWRSPYMFFNAIYSVAAGKVLVEVYPRSRFGQFSSARVMFCSLIVALINYPVGKFSDFLKAAKPGDSLICFGFDLMPYLRGYRFVNYWFALCYAVSMLCLLYFYWHYHRHRKDKAVDL